MPDRAPASPKRRRRGAAARGVETDLGRTRRARRMLRTLETAFPHVYCELDFTNPLELSVATILSAQCTDKRVNEVTPALFRRYRTAADYAGSDREELESLIRSTGFYRNKARSIQGLGAALVEKYDGEVPPRLEDLVTLPGIGRKTANVVLGNAFGIPGLPVDTHVIRLVNRWKWAEGTDAVRIERELMQMLPKAGWTDASHRIIFHGRRVCHARTAACGACVLADDCPSAGVAGPLDPVAAASLVAGPERDHLLELVGLGEPA